jgi:hypothetical protein
MECPVQIGRAVGVIRLKRFVVEPDHKISAVSIPKCETSADDFRYPVDVVGIDPGLYFDV